MKRSLLTLIAILITAGFSLFAKPVSLKEARLAASNFYYERLVNNLHQAVDYSSLSITGAFAEKNGEATAFYVFTFEGRGFVIISADDACYPVLGYSFDSPWISGEYPVHLRGWLDNYKHEIRSVQDGGLQPDQLIADTWQRLTVNDPSLLDNTKVTTDVEPLVQSLWNQDFPYNGMCPKDPGSTGSYSGRVPVGCVATSMSQIMHYWRYPDMGQGSHCIYPQQTAYGPQCADFGSSTYDWNGMPDQTGLESFDLAQLGWHCGIGVDMQYNPSGSASNLQKSAYAMKTYFKYASSTQFMSRSSNYTSWVNTLKGSVDQGKPVQYAGDDNSAGHAFVLDGYQQVGTDYMFHFNWGWGGSYNGYFYINNLNPGGNNFNYHQSAVVQITPDLSIYPPFCNGNKVILKNFGSIEDGSGPVNDYPSNANCSWLIAPDDSVDKITLTFSRFNTSAGDEVKVYDGTDANAPLLGTYSGTLTTMPTVTSSGPALFVTFISDASGSAPGWRANFNSTYEKFCDASTTMTSAWGTINDGSGRFNYRNLSNCKWKIMPSGPTKIMLTVNQFNTEETNDKVQIYDLGTSALLATLSGNYTTPPAPIVSATGSVMVMWSTNNSVRGEGWEISYSPMVGTGAENGFSDLQIHPNPATTRISVKFNVEKMQDLAIELRSVTGDLMFTDLVKNFIGEFQKSYDLTGFARGMYFLRLKADSGTTVRKIIVQ
jgi:hypothetical protein